MSEERRSGCEMVRWATWDGLQARCRGNGDGGSAVKRIFTSHHGRTGPFTGLVDPLCRVDPTRQADRDLLSLLPLCFLDLDGGLAHDARDATVDRHGDDSPLLGRGLGHAWRRLHHQRSVGPPSGPACHPHSTSAPRSKGHHASEGSDLRRCSAPGWVGHLAALPDLMSLLRHPVPGLGRDLSARQTSHLLPAVRARPHLLLGCHHGLPRPGPRSDGELGRPHRGRLPLRQ